MSNIEGIVSSFKLWFRPFIAHTSGVNVPI